MNELRRWQMIFWSGAGIVIISIVGFGAHLFLDQRAHDLAPPVAIPTPAS